MLENHTHLESPGHAPHHCRDSALEPTLSSSNSAFNGSFVNDHHETQAILNSNRETSDMIADIWLELMCICYTNGVRWYKSDVEDAIHVIHELSKGFKPFCFFQPHGSSVALQCEPTAARVARGDEAGRWVEDAKEKKMVPLSALYILYGSIVYLYLFSWQTLCW